MLLSQKSASLAALAFSTLHHASAAPTQSLTSKHLAARAEPKVYMALGDSYASGIAAGDYINPDKTSQDWQCSRFTNAYPRLLNSMLVSPPPNSALLFRRTDQERNSPTAKTEP